MSSSNSHVKQQFQPAQGLQTAVSRESPLLPSQPPLRSRGETPIHPPQLPASRNPAPTPTPAQRHTRQEGQPRQSQKTVPPPPQLQTQQAELDEQFRQAEQAYLAAYHPSARPQAVYHTINPSKTTLTTESPYVLYGTPPQKVAPAPHPSPAQQRSQQDLRFVHSRPPPPVTTGQAQGQPASDAQDETMQDDQSGSGDDDDVEDNDANEDDSSPGNPGSAAPLVQPITPLQYPAVRPTLMLGPYETREEAQKATIEYGIAQGYMLVQSGCARAKTSWGGYDAVRPIVRVDYMCDRSGRCKNVGTGKRKRATHKTGCPTRIKVVCRKRDGCKWFIDPRCELHNHDLNLGNMDSIASYRRWQRLQGGGPSAEPRKERPDRKKKTREPAPPAPVPPATFHNATPQPPLEPTGPVHMAALKGQLKILEILLNRGGNVDAYDSTGRTALHCAIEGSRMDAFKLLLDRGADVTRCDARGLSPLRMAVEKGLEEAVVMLIEKGADPNK